MNIAIEPTTFNVRLNDIVAHRAPNARMVDVYLAALYAGKTLEPLEIDSDWTEHWHDEDGQSEYLGMGYALIEGHDRHAALMRHLGSKSETAVVMQGLEPMKGWRKPE